MNNTDVNAGLSRIDFAASAPRAFKAPNQLRRRVPRASTQP